jgi:integrase
MPDQRHHMLFATMWNTGTVSVKPGRSPGILRLDLRPFVRVLSEKVRARRRRPPKDEVRTGAADGWQFCASDGKLDGHHPSPPAGPLWPVTDETMRNWLKQAVKRAEADGVHFSIAVTPHTFRHSYIMHMLYHR